MMRSLVPGILAALASPLAAGNPSPDVTFEPLGMGSFRLDWSGEEGWSYFIQYSADLQNWHYMPEVFHGVIHDPLDLTPTYEDENGQVFAYPEFFVRLQMSDFPTLDPKNADFDGDGLSNWEELTVYGTDPFNANSTGSFLMDGQTDADGDGLPDQWEQMMLDHLGDPSLTIEDIDPNDDVDGDGLSNLEEFLHGLNPYMKDSDGDGYGDRLSVDRELHLKFDENTGSIAADSSGKGRHGALHATAGWEPLVGIDHGALNLNGASDAVTLPAETLHGATDLTISLWFKTSAAPAAQTLLSTASATQSPELAVSIENGAAIRFDTGGGYPVTWNAGRDLADGLWHHLVLVRNADDGEVLLHLDGAPYGPPQNVSPGVLAVDSVVLGQRHQSASSHDPAHAFTGLLDDVRIYSAVLEAPHAMELFQPNDLDRDGLPDDWEHALFGNLATLSSANDDPDGDGMTNREEFEAGTHPGDYYNGATPVVELVDGADQEILNGRRTPDPLVFRVTSDGATPLAGAPVTLELLGLPGSLETPDGNRLTPPLALTTDPDGEIAVHFRAD